MSIQYPVLGFNSTTSWTRVSSHYNKTSAPAQIHIFISLINPLDGLVLYKFGQNSRHPIK